MKKLLLFVLSVFLISSISFAQVGQGSKYVNASSSLSFSSMKTKYEHPEGEYEYTESQFSIEPSIGYFVMDGLVLGISGLYESSKYKYDNSESDPYVRYGLAVFGKYYFGQGSLKPFGKAEVGLIGSSDGEEDYDKDSGMLFGAGVGVAYFLNEYVAIEGGLDYNMYNLKNKAESDFTQKTSGIQFKVGFTLTF